MKQRAPLLLCLTVGSLLIASVSICQGQQAKPFPKLHSDSDQAKHGEALYHEAVVLQGKGDAEAALAKVSEALTQDPTNEKALILRGDLYAKKQSWADAERDFNATLKVNPDNTLAKFDLAEIDLMQKHFDQARIQFFALTKDADFGDLAAYKVYLCDLFGQDRLAATRELAAFNKAAKNPSYYYANAANSLYLGNPEEARPWIESAVKIYSLEKTHAYLSTLKDFGYVPLPPKKE